MFKGERKKVSQILYYAKKFLDKNPFIVFSLLHFC